MSEDGGVRLSGGPRWSRALLTVVCALGLVLSAAALPFVAGGTSPATALLTNEELSASSSGGVESSSLDGDPSSFGTVGESGSALGSPGSPGESDASRPGESGSAGDGSGGGGLGALGASPSTDVGGSPTGGAGGESALRNQSAEVHFVVESTRPTYWRTGAYDAYTGQGWSRTGDSRPTDGRLDTSGLRDERVDYRVTLRRPASALPTAWQPTSVSVESDSLYVLPGRSLASPDGLPPGTTYTGVSYRPPADPAVLASAGRAYPDGVVSRYATLPENRTSDRVAAFTDEVTADASTPYETAVAVERWLETNREYSLNASHDPDAGTVTDRFLFAMEAGYCEYFATSMTVMLRTQDIPARYVVGYSTGQRTGDGEYTVRAMNAHAWVEVYFPDVGWVRFDPTPAGSRLTAEREAFANRTGSSASAYRSVPDGPATGPGSQTGTAGGGAGGTPGAGGTGTGTPAAGGTGGAGTGTPGTGSGDGAGTGTGTGTAGGTWTADGSGDGDGTSDGSVTGTGTPSGSGDGGSSGGDSDDSGDSGDSGDSDSGESDSGDSGDSDSGDSSDSDDSGSDETDDSESGSEDENGEDGNDSDPSPPPLGVSLNRTAVPGATVEVSVTRGGDPVAGARVLFNGDPVGETDANGTVVAEVPYASELNVTVETGGAAALGAGLSLPNRGGDAVFDVDVDAAVGWALPGVDGVAGVVADDRPDNTTYPLETNATVSVVGEVRSNATVTLVTTVSDVPVREATVLLDGERVATTDRRGRATVRLPSVPGNHTIGVVRGPVAGNTSIRIEELRANHSVDCPLTLPTAPVTVTARLGDERLAGATVLRDGSTVATTGVDGNATVALSARNGVTYTVAAHGQTATTTVTGAVTTAAGVGVALLLALALAIRSGYRRGVSPRAIPRRLFRAVRGVVRVAVAALVAVAEAAVGGYAALRRLVEGVVTRAVALRTVPGRVLALVRAAVTAVVSALLGVPAAIRGLVARRDAAPGDGGTEAEPAPSGAGDDDPAAARLTVRRAWRRFLRLVPVRGVGRRTPGEVARAAIGAGLPAEPVTSLRDAYREVEYGGVDPDTRLPRVRSAMATLTDDGDGSDAGDDRDGPDGPDDANAGDDADGSAVGDDADDADGGSR